MHPILHSSLLLFGPDINLRAKQNAVLQLYKMRSFVPIHPSLSVYTLLLTNDTKIYSCVRLRGAIGLLEQLLR